MATLNCRFVLLGFRVQGSGLRVEHLGFGVERVDFMPWSWHGTIKKKKQQLDLETHWSRRRARFNKLSGC